jgi:hypothetical protein
LHIASGETLTPEVCYGSLAPIPITCADENAIPFFAKLARNFEADTFVGPGYEGDPVFRG